MTMQVWPRAFHVINVTGQVIAEGVQWSDQTLIVRWIFGERILDTQFLPPLKPGERVVWLDGLTEGDIDHEEPPT